MLSAIGVSKRFGAATALDDVSMSVLPGEVVALAGENGSGKSTLVRCLSGGLHPDHGQVVLDGRERDYTSPRSALDDGIAMIAQELKIAPHLSVAENICLPFLRGAAMRPVRRRRTGRRVVEVLRRVELDVDPATPVGSLGVVQQTMVEVAKALVTQPRFLILDEVTSRLGGDDVVVVERLMRQLAAEGVGIVMITHRIKEMTDQADRAVVLRDGRMVGMVERHEMSERALVRLMVGRDVDEKLERATTPDAPVVLDVKDIRVAGSAESMSLTVRAGEIVGLAGLVGAGRSELLEALVGARPRSGGQVAVDGATIAAGRTRAAMDAGVVLVPEDRHRQSLVLDFSVTENLALGKYRALERVRRARDRGAVTSSVKTFGIKVPDASAPIAALSGGNQQKVVLARAIARSPRVLLLDEPTRGVDIGARSDIYRIVAGEADRGMAVLLASSDLVELLSVCSRVLVMHEGRLVADLAGNEATEMSITHASMGGHQHGHVA